MSSPSFASVVSLLPTLPGILDLSSTQACSGRAHSVLFSSENVPAILDLSTQACCPPAAPTQSTPAVHHIYPYPAPAMHSPPKHPSAAIDQCSPPAAPYPAPAMHSPPSAAIDHTADEWIPFSPSRPFAGADLVSQIDAVCDRIG
eukprot:235411_1